MFSLSFGYILFKTTSEELVVKSMATVTITFDFSYVFSVANQFKIFIAELC